MSCLNACDSGYADEESYWDQVQENAKKLVVEKEEEAAIRSKKSKEEYEQKDLSTREARDKYRAELVAQIRKNNEAARIIAEQGRCTWCHQLLGSEQQLSSLVHRLSAQPHSEFKAQAVPSFN